jgi:hypothetical protein
MKFSTKQDYFNRLNIAFRNKKIQELNEVKFLGVMIDNLIMWKKHIELITGKLNKACYIIRRSKQFLNIDTLKMIYFAFFHSIIYYGLIFWGNTYHSVSIFRLQKRAIRIIVGTGYKDSCRKIFSSLKILPLPSLYIFFVLMFMVNNWGMFVINSDMYSTWTRNCSNLHLPSANLSIYQKGTQFIGIKLFNNLRTYIKKLSGNINLFKKTLLQFLYLNSFYSIEEFFKYKDK